MTSVPGSTSMSRASGPPSPEVLYSSIREYIEASDPRSSLSPACISSGAAREVVGIDQQPHGHLGDIESEEQLSTETMSELAHASDFRRGTAVPDTLHQVTCRCAMRPACASSARMGSPSSRRSDGVCKGVVMTKNTESRRALAVILGICGTLAAGIALVCFGKAGRVWKDWQLWGSSSWDDEAGLAIGVGLFFLGTWAVFMLAAIIVALLGARRRAGVLTAVLVPVLSATLNLVTAPVVMGQGGAQVTRSTS